METARAGATSLGAYLSVIRRRWLLVILPLALVVAAAVAFSLYQQKLYQASTQVLITDQNAVQSDLGQQLPNATDPTRVANTETELAQVPAVAQRTLNKLHLRDRSALDLLRQTNVSAASDADILTLSVTDPDSSLAIRLVNQYTHQFILFRKQLDTAAVRAALQGLSSRIRDIEHTIATDAESNPALNDQLRSLLNRQQDLQTLEQLQGGKLFVVRPATQAEQTQPKTIRNVAAATVVGLILGLGLAFLAHALDTRVRSAHEVEALLKMPLLGRIPPPPRSLSKRHRLAMLTVGKPSHAEAYRNLRTSIDLANLAGKAKTVVVTSAVEREGKSTTAANLAVAMALTGRHVALLDLDLRRPLIARFFALEGRPGVTTVITGAASLDDALVPVVVEKGSRVDREEACLNGADPSRIAGVLDVVPAGLVPPDPSEILATGELAAIIEQLRGRCDIVLIDSPPALPVSDAMTMTTLVDAIVVVVRAGETRRASLFELQRMLDTAPCLKLGFVLTGAESEEGYGYEGYNSYESISTGGNALPSERASNIRD